MWSVPMLVDLCAVFGARAPAETARLVSDALAKRKWVLDFAGSLEVALDEDDLARVYRIWADFAFFGRRRG